MGSVGKKKKKVTNYNYVGRQSSGVKTEIGGEGIRNGFDQNTCMKF